MADDYNVLKEKNLHQMVAEYEAAEHEKKQLRLEYLEDSVSVDTNRFYATKNTNEGPAFWSPYDFRNTMMAYTADLYRNQWATLIRSYAAIYDKNNLDDYPEPDPLPTLATVMREQALGTNYYYLKKLAICPRCR